MIENLMNQTAIGGEIHIAWYSKALVNALDGTKIFKNRVKPKIVLTEAIVLCIIVLQNIHTN